MKATLLKIKVTYNTGNYENIRIGAEFSPVEGADYNTQMADAEAELRTMVYAIMQRRQQDAQAMQKAQEEAKEKAQEEAKDAAQVEEAAPEAKSKEPLTMASPALQKILKRIEGGVKLDKVLEYYAPDDEAMKVLKLAAKMN